MKRSSQPPGVAAPAATAGLPSRIPVAISRGHRASACDTLMFDWLLRSGSLKPSKTCPSCLTWLSVAAVTLAAPPRSRPPVPSRLGPTLGSPV